MNHYIADFIQDHRRWFESPINDFYGLEEWAQNILTLHLAREPIADPYGKAFYLCTKFDQYCEARAQEAVTPA